MLHSIDPPQEFVPLTREDPSAFSPPPAFGPFRVLHQIGIGALGPVFRTYEPARDRLIAVKVFRLDIVPEQAQALADALTEATQASLFHPSIVEPIAAGVEGTLAYRAEEYVAAESLDVAMRHYAPAPLEKGLPFITQLAGAIDFARAAGVGHGALHPRDIFVTPDEARATGFGVVEALERVGIRAPIRRPYSAPERIQGQAWSTPADIFALAAIAFELLTGRRPSGTGAQIGALPEGPFSSALHAVLARGMDDDPGRRFPTALALAAALEAAGRGESVAVSPVPVASPAATKPVSAAVVPVVAPTAGALAAEKDLLSARPAIDDAAAGERTIGHAGERTLFDANGDDLAGPVRDQIGEGPLVELDDEDGPTNRFADDFVDEQTVVDEETGADDRTIVDDETVVDERTVRSPVRRSIEPLHEAVVPVPYAPHQAPHHTMFGATSSQADLEMRDDVDRSRLRILPVALGVVVGLLIGFGIGHFVGSRNRTDTSAGAAGAVQGTQTAATPTGAATPQQPGTYSEQKVAPASRPSTPSAAPPPIPNEGPSASPRTPAAPTRGRLVVTSTPSRAGVTVNGDWRGRTPLTLDSLPIGRYALRLVRPGYHVARHEATISARDTTQEVRVRLERIPAGRATTPPAPRPAPARPAPADVFTGSLYVDSRPRGATVFLNGRSVGQTPVSLPEIPIGAHVVRLELAGKQSWTTSTRVVAGEMTRVTGSLEDKNDAAPMAGRHLERAPAAAGEGRREPPRGAGPSQGKR